MPQNFCFKFVLPLFLLPTRCVSPLLFLPLFSLSSFLPHLLFLDKTKSKSRHAATARTTTVARLSASKAECNSAQMISSCEAASPKPSLFRQPLSSATLGPFYKRTRGTCTLFALNFFWGIFCCPSANAAYAQQCLAALIFRSILLRAARFVFQQLKVGNEKLKTLLHKLTVPLLLFPLFFLSLPSSSFSLLLFLHLLTLLLSSRSVNFKKNEKEYQADRSEVLKFLREEETGQSTPGNQPQPNYELARLLLLLNDGCNPFLSDILAD